MHSPLRTKFETRVTHNILLLLLFIIIMSIIQSYFTRCIRNNSDNYNNNIIVIRFRFFVNSDIDSTIKTTLITRPR